MGKEFDVVREFVGVRLIRESVGKPSRKEISLIARDVIPLWRSTFYEKGIEMIADTEALASMKSNYDREPGSKISRPHFCSEVLNTAFTSALNNAAVDLFNAGDFPQYRFCYDASTGIALTLGGIMLAETELLDVGEEGKRRAVVIFNRILSGNSDAKKTYLFMKRSGNDLFKLLIDDPSGFKLIDDAVAKIKNGFTKGISFSYQPKEYVLAGAELARDLYKELYKTTEPLFPSASRK